MLHPLLHVYQGLLNVEVNPVDEWALINDKFIQLFIDAGELVNWFGEVGDLLIPFYVFTELCLAYLHFIKLILHLLTIFLSQLNGCVESAGLIHSQSVKVHLFLCSKGTTNFSDFHTQRSLHVAIN